MLNLLRLLQILNNYIGKLKNKIFNYFLNDFVCLVVFDEHEKHDVMGTCEFSNLLFL